MPAKLPKDGEHIDDGVMAEFKFSRSAESGALMRDCDYVNCSALLKMMIFRNAAILAAPPSQKGQSRSSGFTLLGSRLLPAKLPEDGEHINDGGMAEFKFSRSAESGALMRDCDYVNCSDC